MIIFRRFVNSFPWGKALLLWMLVIFYFSSRPGSPYPTDTSLGYFLERKGAHVFEYAVLTVILMVFLRRFFQKEPLYGVALLAFFLAAFYGVTDEIHQYFVPFRGAKMSDVGFDILGAVLGISFVYIARGLFLRGKKHQ
ncbi:MAG: VanZ family protein [Candidatus Moranbacteria bacterium]|nr:VanZ family protein [Candidatus Moranbacteria bacterium]